MFNIEVFNTCQMPFWPSKKLSQNNGCNLQIETWLESNLGILAYTSKFQLTLTISTLQLQLDTTWQAEVYVNVDF